MAEPSFLDRLGGEALVVKWTRVFYEAVARDPVLAPLFPDDLTESREKQAAFFVEFLGGPPRFSEKYGPPFMRYRHRHVRIGQVERDAWMAQVGKALLAVAPDNPVTGEILERMGKFADHMINHKPGQKDAKFFN